MVMGFDEKMTTLADTIRNKTNQTKDLTLDEMATSVESIEVGAPVPTDEEMLELLMDMDVVQPLSNTNNVMYVDENNKIYVL